MTADSKPKGLNVAIIGAGISGLTTAIAFLQQNAGHRVTVLEKYANCQPTFSGPVQIHTNATRVLAQYGVEEAITACLPILNSVHNIHRFTDGYLLYNLPAAVSMKNYKSPIWNISRSVLLGILLTRAEELGAFCKFSAGVADVDGEAERPVVTLENGDKLPFDLVIGADGVRSKVRTTFLGPIEVECPLDCYTVDIDREKIAADDEIAFLLNRSGFWVGPGQSVVGMDLPSGCNFMFCCESDKGDEGVWDKRFDLAEVRKQFANVDPRLHKILDLCDGECYIWKLSAIPTLDTWSSKSGKVVVIGDAAHAMLPFASQGAGTSIEDSACLAECVTRIANLRDATAAFEAIRKPRTTFIAKAGELNLQFSHMMYGPEQEARDAALEKMRDEEANRVAPPPADQATATPQALEDFAPPEKVTNLFTPIARAYVSKYDVFAHTKAHLQAHA